MTLMSLLVVQVDAKSISASCIIVVIVKVTPIIFSCLYIDTNMMQSDSF